MREILRPMAKFTCTMESPIYYSLASTCHAHGWKHLQPFKWIEETATLGFALQENDKAADIQIEQRGTQLLIAIESRARISARAEKLLLAKVRRVLDVDRDLSEFYAIAASIGGEYAALVKSGAGRLLHGASLWEDAAKTLFTTNCSWSLTVKMAEAACSETLALRAPSGAFAFPSPDRISIKTSSELREVLPIGYRAAFFHSLATEFNTDAALGGVESNPSRTFAAKKVGDLMGFGPYATNHVLVMAGFFEEIPVDSIVTAFVASVSKARDPHAFVFRRYRPWGRYAWWGYKFDQMLRRKS